MWQSNLLSTHLPLVPHICVNELGQHWFRYWLVTYLVPSHYLNQCYLIVSWTLSNLLSTHLPLVPHICVNELGQHWFRYWLVTYLMPSHYLNQCYLIVSWTLRNKLQWYSNQNTEIFVHKNASDNTSAKRRPFCARGESLKLHRRDGKIDFAVHQANDFH